jgi:hypothetical protein
VVLAIFLLVFALDNGEGLHDVVHVVAWRWKEVFQRSELLF